MAAKKSKDTSMAQSKKMNTQKMSSTSKKKMTPSIDGGKTIPPMKKGRPVPQQKETFNNPKKLKKKTN